MRAEQLFAERVFVTDHAAIGAVLAHQRSRALQLGREMAEAAREETVAEWMNAEGRLRAAYMRLRKLIPGALDTEPGADLGSHTEACLRKLLGAADERAEEIAIKLYPPAKPWTARSRMIAVEAAAHVARSTISKPEAPKSREAVLEEALREVIHESERLAKDAKIGVSWLPNSPRMIARRALEWKP